MAGETWDVDRDYVEKYLVAYRLSVNAKGGDIDEMIEQAAGDIRRSLRVGGYEPADITDTDAPDAYLQVRRAVAVCASYLYIMSLNNQSKSIKLDKLLDYCTMLKKQIEEDPFLGEVENTTGENSSVYRHDGDTRQDMMESKINWDYTP